MTAVRCRTKPVYSLAEQVTGLVRIVNGKPVQPGWWVIDRGVHKMAVPPGDFETMFEVLPDLPGDDDGVKAVATLCAHQVASEFPDAPPAHVQALAMRAIELFMVEAASDAPNGMNVDPEPAPGQPAPPSVGSRLGLGYDPDHDAVKVSIDGYDVVMPAQQASEFANGILRCAALAGKGRGPEDNGVKPA